MLWRFAAFFGLFAVLVPATAHAQTNIDAGKTPAQMFDSDCAVCHKATRGLAAGKSNSTLTEFLTEHYTSSRQQAAALAAYVLGAGGALAAAPAQERGQKPAEHGRASADEPKPNRRERHAERSEPETSTDKPHNEQERRHRATAERHEGEPGVVIGRRHRNEPAAPPSVPPEPAVNAAPGSGETSNQAVSSQESGSGQNTPAPADAQPSASAPAPRDNIPD